MWKALIVGALLATAPTATGAETVTLAPVRDTTLFEDAGGALAGGAGPYLFTGDNGSLDTRRALLAFDVAAAVPAGARIERATLHLHMSNSPDTTAITSIALHPMRVSWGEGASVSTGGSGAPSAPGDATWMHRFYPDVLWADPGGDFDVLPVIAFGVRRLGPYNVSTTFMTQDVQSWLDRPELAFGWLVLGEEGTPSTARRFDSREHPDPGRRPYLVVDYTVTPVTPTRWGDVKSRFRD